MYRNIPIFDGHNDLLLRFLHFWCDLCGFVVAYDRPQDRFAYLDRSGCQVMLEEMMAPGRHWITAPLEKPFGRGINFQITVNDVTPILTALLSAQWPLFLGLEEMWYRASSSEVGSQQFLVQDPDGYLVRFSQGLGLRPAKGAERSADRVRQPPPALVIN